MQKKIIALAIAAAFSAPAMADVNVYGVVDAAVVRATADGQKSDIQAVSGGLASSRIGVTGAEDLNNGMKAVVKLEYGLDTEIGSGLTAAAARQQMLAVAGDFGTVATGYLQTTGYDWGVKFDPLAGSAVSPLSAVTAKDFMVGDNAVAKRAQRALAYISPNMSGFSFAVNYSTAVDASAIGYGTANNLGNLTVGAGSADKKITAYLLGAYYDVGALSVGAVYSKVNLPAGVTNNNVTPAAPLGADVGIADVALGASYDLGVVKLFATYQQSKADVGGASADKAMSLSAVAPVGPGAVAVSYAKNTIASTAAADNAKGLSVVWLQGLSKTTTFYAAYEKVSQDAAGAGYSVLNNALAPAAGAGSNVIAVGLNKKF